MNNKLLIAHDNNPLIDYLASLQSNNSKKQMQRNLTVVARILLNDSNATAFDVAWENLRRQDILLLRDHLQKTYSTPTVNNILSALRGILKACWRAGLIGESDFRLAIDVPNLKHHTLPAGRFVHQDEVAKLLRHCLEQGAIGIRDAAMIGMFYATGIRRDELAGIQMQDIDLTGGVITVLGKGNKERTVYLSGQLQHLFDMWLRHRTGQPGYLFPPILKSGRIKLGERLTGEGVYYILKKRQKETGLNDFSPHDLRRTFITVLLDTGSDLSIVSQIVGHSSTNQTKRYDRRPEEAKRKAQLKVDVPL